MAANPRPSPPNANKPIPNPPTASNPTARPPQLMPRGSGRMAGVIFVLEFLEFFLVFPGEDLGFGEDAGLEVGVDDAGLAFGGRGTVGLASIVTRGGDLLLGAHKKGSCQV